MAKSRQSSFRRILVSKILLISVPLLLIGEIVAYKKASSSFLETARQNLTQSAIIKGDKIVDAIAALKANLLTATQTTTLKSGSRGEIQDFITQLAKELPRYIECIQVTNPHTQRIVASTCGYQKSKLSQNNLFSENVNTLPILPPKLGLTGKINQQNQLRLLFSAPVYDYVGNFRYTLNIQSTLLHQQKNNQPGLLTGSTMVIAEDGTILAHPITSRVGTNITKHADGSQLQKILKNAVAGQKNFLHLFFEKQGEELLAGYTAISVPGTNGHKSKWVILAVTDLDNALYGLGQIKFILLGLTIGLIVGTLLAALYLARCLARPLEELRDYALGLHSHHATLKIPGDFQIKELDQLAQALESMVDRLKAWAEEVEIAWKESKSANQIKTQFLATTSHELRNPLNTIINCLRIVREGLCDDREEEMEFIQRVEDTALYLLGIINELLDISKIESGKLSVILEPIDLRLILLEVINLQSVNIQQKGLQLNIPQINEIIPVNGDEAKLKQVLINVIGNATKFTEQGSITVSYEIRGSQVIITVKDTGVGIDPAQQHKLFHPFVMINGSTTRKFEGTGLGLAISRNLMELMGGKITLQSVGINQGTTVTITLPMIDASLLANQQSIKQLITHNSSVVPK